MIERDKLLCRIDLQDLWHKKSLPDGWAGGRTGPDEPDEMLSISLSKAVKSLGLGTARTTGKQAAHGLWPSGSKENLRKTKRKAQG